MELSHSAVAGLSLFTPMARDGSASTGDSANPRPFSLTRGQLGVQYRAEELIRVAQSLLAGGLETFGGDPKNLLVGGHSYGGPTAILAADARPDLFSGLVLHDPALSSSMPAVKQPVFSILGDQYAGISSLVREVCKVSPREPQQPWAGAWHFQGISHGNFVDAPLWAPLIIMRLLGFLLIPAAGPEEPAEAHRQMAEAAASFATGAGRAPSASPAWKRLG